MVNVLNLVHSDIMVMITLIIVKFVILNVELVTVLRMTNVIPVKPQDI
jgi:hypothetical protein